MNCATETISTVAVTGGHLGASLGVIELTVALHYVFDTPKDKLIWDVGHQAYPHKILTGRRDRIRTLRQAGGLSGFTKRAESEYDCFGAAHSSTSISAGLGMAVARDLAGDDYNVVSVIGDGAISAGMAYEAMNNAGAHGRRLIVIFNDNEMSIAPPVGAMSTYLTRLFSSPTYMSLRDIGKQIAEHLPAFLKERALRAEELARGFVTGGTLFEELGFYYVGVVDGHDLDQLVPVLENVRDAKEGPILVHVRTQKGKGYAPAEASADKYHGVVKFDVATGKQTEVRRRPRLPTPRCSANIWSRKRSKDERIVAITAAMPGGTGIDIFAKAFPERAFDVGIAEQHAVTFAAGLATQGFKPFCAIYSTFLQRAYDQVVHDVAIQRLPVRFAHRPRRPGRRRRPDPCRLVRSCLSRLPARLRAHGGGRRGRARAHGCDRRANRRPPLRLPLSARRGHRRADARSRAPRSRSAAAASCAKAHRRLAVVWRAAAGMHEGGRHAGGAGHLNHGGGRPLCKAARFRSNIGLARAA